MGPNGPEPDMSRVLSGHPEGAGDAAGAETAAGPVAGRLGGHQHRHAGPWGVSFTANLTPDAETGLGRLDACDDFKDTIRTGRHMGRGRAVLPPMPIPVYNNFTDRDLEASSPTCARSPR